MKSVSSFALLVIILSLSPPVQSQNFYPTTGGELIFSSSNVQFDGDYIDNNLRFTMFFHTQQNWHYDFFDNVGMFFGWSIRNVGFITEDLSQNSGFPEIVQGHSDYNKTIKIKRRSYSLGIPLALKIGSFKNDFFFFAGGEYEWMFHYKQKLFMDDTKYKFTEWASHRVNPLQPSLFGGVQFPGGIQLKFKYYLDDFLNKSFTGNDFGYEVDYSAFDQSNIWYISLSFQIGKEDLFDFSESEDTHSTTYELRP